MQYEDRISIATPEGLDLELTLAGVGSRFIAALIDGLIQGAVLVALSLLVAALWAGSETDVGEELGDGVPGGIVAGIAVAVLIVVVFVVFFGYHVAFETWASGRTPGKRWTGLRVVRRSGAPVTFLTSAVRNVLRLVDFLPTLYGVGVIAILASTHNQRLGDLAAGTLVVREGRASTSPAQLALSTTEMLDRSWAGAAPGAPAWDVSAVSAEELATVRQFLARRPYLTADARNRLGFELATRLRPKVVGPSDDMHPEAFLAELAAAKATRG